MTYDRRHDIIFQRILYLTIAGGIMDEPKKVAIVEDDAKTREMLRGFFSD